MPKRVANWKPDIYDLAAARDTGAAASDVTDLAARGRSVEGTERVVVTTPDALAAVADLEADDELLPEPVAVPPLATVRTETKDYRVTVRSGRKGDGDLAGLGGMVGGAIIGALLGLLVAPRRGEQTRRQLVDQAKQQLRMR